VNATTNDNEPKIVYWHRDLPPLEAELIAEHTVEANSSRVPGTIAHRDELWDRCYRELMATAESRLARLDGAFARQRQARESRLRSAPHHVRTRPVSTCTKSETG
jgi:hypothetical protein